MWQAWINIIAGGLIFISAFWQAANEPVNYLILGLIIAITGFMNSAKQWQGVVNGIIGLWLILSGFFPALQSPANLVITGLIVMSLAIWRATAVISSSRRRPSHA